MVAAFGVAWIARRHDRLDAVEAAALVMAGFLLLTPGFGIQYSVWVVPLLFAAAPRSAAAYSATGGVFAFLVYLDYWSGGFPARSDFHDRYAVAAALFGFWAWVVLLGFARNSLRVALRSTSAGANDPWTNAAARSAQQHGIDNDGTRRSPDPPVKVEEPLGRT